MDYQKINFDELGFYCKSTRSDGFFKGSPTLGSKIEVLIEILIYYGITEFEAEDIYKILMVLKMKSLRTQKIIKIKLDQVEKILEKLSQKGKLENENKKYIVVEEKILQLSNYKEEIKLAYEREYYMKDWIEWAKENKDVCEEVSREVIKLI